MDKHLCARSFKLLDYACLNAATRTMRFERKLVPTGREEETPIQPVCIGKLLHSDYLPFFLLTTARYNMGKVRKRQFVISVEKEEFMTSFIAFLFCR